MVSTPATVGHCPRCRAQILNGWAEGLLARVDLTPLTVAGEHALRQGGRETYALAATELIALDAWRATDHAHRLLLPGHECRRPVDAIHRAVLPGVNTKGK
jgi:hypothetical protein